MPPVAGAYPISGVGKLPNVTIAHPGEVWSDQRALGNIVPGAAIIPVDIAGKKGKKQIAAGDAPDRRQVAVALRQVEVPDINPGSQYSVALGPNEIVNLLIADGDYLRSYHTGILHLTLVTPRDDYANGQLIGWNPAGARPAGKAAGTGAWTNVTADIKAGTDIFEVHEPYRPYGAATPKEGILTVRFLRGDE
jgi:hypothetical protein